MSKNLYTLSLDSIKYILGLIRDTVDLPANILDDLHIQSTTTYSSYRLDTLLKALKEENIQYCDEAISKLNKLSKEIITDKLQITNENTIYLLLTDPVNNVYEQWLLINGTPQMIGTTEMKLDSVYTKDEADDRYALLTDFNTLTTSFNNLVTSVENKVDKDKIATVLDDSVTDEQVASAKVVYDKISSIMSASPTSYSLDEQVIGTWIDGKPIYRKTFYSANGWSTNANIAVIGNISNLKLVVNLRTVCYNSSDNYWSTPYIDSDQCNAFVTKSTGKVCVVNQASFINKEQLVVVEYTKTTD